VPFSEVDALDKDQAFPRENALHFALLAPVAAFDDQDGVVGADVHG
jgi:hypothetical protein